MLLPLIKSYLEDMLGDFNSIPTERKEDLAKIAGFVVSKLKKGQKAELIYICTHNSRRSHFGQIWAQAAASYYGLDNVFSYSGGTEVTAFNLNAIRAIEKAGFIVKSDNAAVNPHYAVLYDNDRPEIISFSKVYDDDLINPGNGFCAVMTCSDADDNCPLIKGADLRIRTAYEDPKVFENTPRQEAIYDERCRQIAIETLYAFSLVVL